MSGTKLEDIEAHHGAAEPASSGSAPREELDHPLPNALTATPLIEKRLESASEVHILRERVRFLQRQLKQRDDALSEVARRLLKPMLDGEVFPNGPLADFDQSIERTVLSTDISKFSLLSPEKRTSASALIDRTSSMLLEEHGAGYGNDWGDAVVNVFADSNDAIEAALRLTRLMAAEGLRIRVGLAFGELTRVRKHLQRRVGFDGPPLIEAARLEPMASPGEVIAGASLAYSGLVDLDRFHLACEARPCAKAHGLTKVGDPVEVFVVTRRGVS